MVLSEEKIAKIQSQLAGLSEAEKEKKLQEIISGMSEDEVNEMNEGKCIFCLISQGNIQATKVFENSDFMAVLDINPANPGHVILFPKKHFKVLGQMDDYSIKELFLIANKIGVGIFEGLNAEGTNIFVANGAVAGQNAPHVLVHIIPRYKDDKISFEWVPKELKDPEKLAKKIISKIPEDKKEKTIKRVEEVIDDVDYDDQYPGSGFF
ncbi:MAG: HIT family protein [Candidatus Nanoarchaeia archaeon]|nr:HIT family protein [Candidatus Nanoarchaeia archaeon]